MQISIAAPYDKKQVRRTLAFLARRQSRIFRIAGVIFMIMGIAPVIQKPSKIDSYLTLIFGLVLVFLLVPITAFWASFGQSTVIKSDAQLTLDDECLTASYPLAQSRLRWEGFTRVLETKEAWYLMCGKYQTVLVPKNRMTEAQRAEFAAFLGTVQIPKK